MKKKKIVYLLIFILSFNTFLSIKLNKLTKEINESIEIPKDTSQDEKEKLETLIDNYDASKFSETMPFADTIVSYFKSNITVEDKKFLNDSYKELYKVKRVLDRLEKSLKEINYSNSNTFFEIPNSKIYRDSIETFKDEIALSNPSMDLNFTLELSYGEDYSYLIVNGEKYRILDKELEMYLKALEDLSRNYIDENGNDEEYFKNIKIITNQCIRNLLVNYELVEEGREKVCKSKVTYAKILKNK